MAGHAKTLNPRQYAFAQAIAIEGLNDKEARLKAGYSNGRNQHKTSNRLKQDPLVKAEIDRLRAITSASLIMDAQTWQQELLRQYEACDNEGDRANALAALDKWAKRLNLYEQHESSSRATEVLSALAGIGARMIASRQAEKAPVTVEARISGLLHQDDKDARTPSRTRVLTVGETGDQGEEAGEGVPSHLDNTQPEQRDSPQL